ncbi:MAG: transcriptional repressor LexA [Armatimonadetes bacterium]|nr:transcriptional repressor LexA [Armatimonadota bacterium]
MSSKKPSTWRRQQILDFIRRTIQEQGFPPTVREICRAVGLRSTSTVHFHLRALERAGLLKREPLLTRAMRPMDMEHSPKQQRVRYVPLVGRVAAGTPVLAEQNVEELIPLPEGILPAGEAFMLRVRGDSMIGDGIYDGDLVVVQRQDTADDGDLVVALIEDEAVVKRFIRHSETIELRSSNPVYPPIYVREARVLGVVVGLLRRFR